MKPKTMILMVVAVTCGLGASYMTSRLLSERGEAEDTGEKVTVLVAKKNLDMGLLIKNPADLFEEKQFSKGDEPKNCMVEHDQLKGRSLKRPLRAGDWVMEEDLFEKGKSGMMGHLPEGHLAIGIRVNPESIAGGFASLPLSRVDIFSTVRRGDDKSSYSMRLMEDVLVLAADSNPHRDPESRAQLATVVTVALKPQDVAKVRLAENFGPLTLALRGFGEKKNGDDFKTTFQDIVMNTGEKKHDVITGPPDPIGNPPVVTSTQPPVVTPKPIEQPKEVAKLRTHRVTVTTGAEQTFWEYTLDENDRVVDCRQVTAGSQEPRVKN